MKNLYSGFLLGLMLICSSLFYGIALTSSDKKFQQDSSALDGTWRLVAVRHLDASGKALPEQSAAPLNALKIVANRHFSTITTSTDGRILSTTAGLMELTKDLYREYSGFTPDHKTAKAYHWQLNQGLLIQRRTEAGRQVEEVWQLVD